MRLSGIILTSMLMKLNKHSETLYIRGYCPFLNEGGKMNKLSKAITFAKIVGNSYSKKIIPSISSMDIIITDLCNLSCKMCEVRYFKKRSIMPYDTFKKLIDEGTRLGLKKVNLAASGESTLHPDFPKMAEYASARILN